MLHTIYYISKSKPNFSFFEQQRLFLQTKENNDTLNISGALIHYDLSFLQILEGEDSIIIPLFEKIKCDNRHQDIIEIRNDVIDKRIFKSFGIGYEVINDVEKLYSLKEYLNLLEKTEHNMIHINLVTNLIEKFLSIDFK